MSLNIFQMLKQGTSTKKANIQHIKTVESKLEAHQKPANLEILRSGKFNSSDSEDDADNDKNIHDEEILRKNHNRREEKLRVLRKIHNIHVKGDNTPDLISNFTKLEQKYKMKHQLLINLGKMGFTHPTPVQMQVVPALLNKRNALVTAPTGSGKTIAFALPVLQSLQHKDNKIQAIIFAPFFQLAEQIHRQMVQLAAGTDLTIETITQLKQQQRISKKHHHRKLSNQVNQNQEKHLHGVADILVATPLAFINMFGQRLDEIKDLTFVILDECDKYFQQSFLEQIKQILNYLQHCNPIYGLFSATIQHPVEELLKSELLDDAVRVQVGGKNNVLGKIKQTLQYASNQFGKLVQIRNIINQGRFVPPVLLFVQSKDRAKDLFFELRKIFRETMQAPEKAEYITADKSKQQREAIIDKFQAGNIWALVATDLIARGIDFKGVNLVINYDFPVSMLTYIHRVGRTGRADRDGDAITLFTDDDKELLRSLANLLKVSGCNVPEWILQLPKTTRKRMKQIEKVPVVRDAISLAPNKHVDVEWRKKLNMMDKRFKKQQKEKEAQNANNDDDGWQVVGPDDE